MGSKYYPVIDLIATGKNIVRLRKANGYSVAELQEFFGFEAPQAIYKWQQGKSLPSTDNLYALSYLLEVPIEDILVQAKPSFQVLPQEESCGSDFFGAFSIPLRRIKNLKQGVLTDIIIWVCRMYSKTFCAL